MVLFNTILFSFERDDLEFDLVAPVNDDELLFLVLLFFELALDNFFEFILWILIRTKASLNL